MKITNIELTRFITNVDGLKGEILERDLITLEDGSKWINNKWESTAGGRVLYFVNVDNLEVENGLYNLNELAWNDNNYVKFPIQTYDKIRNAML